jgi:hypothetical protein
MVGFISGTSETIPSSSKQFVELSSASEICSPRGWGHQSTIACAEPLVFAKNEPKPDSCNQLLHILHWIVYVITFKLVDLFPPKTDSDDPINLSERSEIGLETPIENVAEAMSFDNIMVEISYLDSSSAPDIPEEPEGGPAEPWEQNSPDEEGSNEHIHALIVEEDLPPPESPRPQSLIPLTVSSSTVHENSISSDGSTTSSQSDSDTSSHTSTSVEEKAVDPSSDPDAKEGGVSSVASDDNDGEEGVAGHEIEPSEEVCLELVSSTSSSSDSLHASERAAPSTPVRQIQKPGPGQGYAYSPYNTPGLAKGQAHELKRFGVASPYSSPTFSVKV